LWSLRNCAVEALVQYSGCGGAVLVSKHCQIEQFVCNLASKLCMLAQQCHGYAAVGTFTSNTDSGGMRNMQASY
jgi:hypothetical protein